MLKRRLLFFVPLIAFILIAIFMARNLGHPQQAVIRSQMIGKPVPEFTLAPLENGEAGLSRADLAGGDVVLVNLFASWCLPCAVEAPYLQKLADQGATIYGIAVQDAPEDTQAFLKKYGNPYARIGSDRGGQMMVAFGASGVPETYVIDGKAVIRHQHLGDIRAEDVHRILARMQAAR